MSLVSEQQPITVNRTWVTMYTVPAGKFLVVTFAGPGEWHAALTNGRTYIRTNPSLGGVCLQRGNGRGLLNGSGLIFKEGEVIEMFYEGPSITADFTGPDASSELPKQFILCGELVDA